MTSNAATKIDVEKWRVAEIIDALNPSPQLGKRIIVPRFQRGLRWSTNQRENLISSIKNKFPIGSLLMYSKGRENNVELYSVVDGLQRCHTLKDYDQNKFHYISKQDFDQEFMDNFLNSVITQNNENLEKTALTSAILDWLHNRNGFDNAARYTSFYFLSEIAKSLSLDPLTNDNAVMDQVGILLDSLKDKMDISNFEIPIVSFEGDAEHLPEIFERLNTRGTRLDKYEIFAATWSHKTIEINDHLIKDAVIRKYQSLTKIGFYYEDELSSTSVNNFTYFDWLFGLGKKLKTLFPDLLTTRSKTADDEIEPIGFVLTALCIKLMPSQMAKLPDSLSDFDLVKLGEAIVFSADFVNESLASILKIRLNGEKDSSITINQFQASSFISFAFHRIYEIKESINEKQILMRKEWRHEKMKAERGIRNYYLYDTLTDRWNKEPEAELRKMAYPSDSYLHLPKTEDWVRVLDTWFESQLSIEHVERTRVAAPSLIFLRYLYTREISFHDNAHQHFHIEHLIPVDRLRKAVEIDGIGYPMSCIANLSLLKKEMNLSKRARTISEYFEYKASRGQIEKTEARRECKKILSFAFVQDSNELLIPQSAARRNAPNKVWYLRFLRRRFKFLKEIILRNLSAT